MYYKKQYALQIMRSAKLYNSQTIHSAQHILGKACIPYGMKRRNFGNFLTILAMVAGFCFAVASCISVLASPKAVAQTTNMRIVVDAGHGGMDGGVVGVVSGRKESDINLAISFLVKDRLTELGFAVTMTRATAAGLYDTTASGFKLRDMQKRREVCEAASPLCVLSIHQNFFPNSSSRGGQVFFREDNERAGQFALAIQAQLNELYEKENVKPRVAKSADYYMLRITPPSLIIECGFLSNPKDDALLNTPLFCGKLADAIVAGLLSEVKNLSSS